jgi:hypothetical protein
MSEAAGERMVVTAESKINEILERCPTVGPILVQIGKGWVNRPGDLYAQYPDLTLAGFAELNGLDAGAVVRRIAAAVEAEEMARRLTGRSRGGDEAGTIARPPVIIGYTGRYSETEADPPAVPVVAVQSARGPE